MSTPEDSLFSLVMSQPVVLWSFVLGMLVLVTAVSLNILASIRRKKQRLAKTQLLVQTVTVAAEEAATQTAADALPENTPVEEAKSTPKTAVNPLAAIAEDADEANDPPEVSGVEVNSKLADLFQNDIIIDPHVQALRDSLDDEPLADLLAQLHDVADQLKEHIPQPAFEVEK
ncbi:MAG: hypothetical protein R3D55_24395 [Chloroflexota bacterium]